MSAADGSRAELDSHAGPSAATAEVSQLRLTMALAWRRANQLANSEFGPWCGGSVPGWAMLLEAYIENHVRGRAVSVTDICRASLVAPTTALRWLAKVEADGILRRGVDPKDGRRVLIEITPLGLEKLHRALDGAVASDDRLGLSRLRLTERIEG